MKKVTINNNNNFIRIFKLPETFPHDYCFNGGHDTIFVLVDWFNPVDQQKLWKGDFILDERGLEGIRDGIREFVKAKQYFLPEFEYMAITAYGDAFMINPHIEKIY